MVNRCKATTLKGRRCLKANGQGEFCHIHQPNEKRIKYDNIDYTSSEFDSALDDYYYKSENDNKEYYKMNNLDYFGVFTVIIFFVGLVKFI
jgi:hypothetical protein